MSGNLFGEEIQNGAKASGYSENCWGVENDYWQENSHERWEFLALDAIDDGISMCSPCNIITWFTDVKLLIQYLNQSERLHYTLSTRRPLPRM